MVPGATILAEATKRDLDVRLRFPALEACEPRAAMSAVFRSMLHEQVPVDRKTTKAG